MTTDSDTERTKTFLRVLGDELRTARKQHGWIRKELQHRLRSEVSLQTIATYELGTRPCSVARLLELTDALDVSMLDILARTLERVGGLPPAAGLYVDLIVAAQIRLPELAPLRRWAACRVTTAPGPMATVILIPLPALERLAELCGIDTVDLIRRLITMAVGMPGSYRRTVRRGPRLLIKPCRQRGAQ